MDAGTVIVIILLAIIGLAALAIILQFRMRDKAADASAYGVRMTANASVLNSMRQFGAHRVTIDATARMMISPAAAEQVVTEVVKPIDPRDVNAVRLVKASLEEYGPRGMQIIPANKLRGMSPNTRGVAVKRLIELGFVYIETDGEIQKTVTKQPLSAILAQLPSVDTEALDRAVAALPRRNGQVATENDNGITGDNDGVTG